MRQTGSDPAPKNSHRGGTLMEKQTFHIPKISCGHCTRTIENELKEIEGVSGVESNIAEKSITVQFNPPVTKAKIEATLQEINYPAAG
jgi:copper chaperone